MKAPSLLELQRMNKNEKNALYGELTGLGMFYGVEKGNTKGKQSVCKGCNMIMAKGGNLRFRHLVCTPRCYAPKVTNDTCGRWHPECLVATQEANPERFVLTNPEFKPIKASWQLAGFDDLSNEEQDLILRVLEGKTGVVTKRRLSSSILTRKLSFTGSKPSANLAADPVNVVEDATATKPSPDRVLPKIILRSPSKLNSEIKKEVVVKSPVKIAGEEIDTSALSAPSAGTITSVTSHSAINGNGASKLAKSPTKSMNSANGTPTSPSKITAKPVAIPIVNVASSPNKPSSVPLKSPSNGTTLNAVSAPGNPISPGTDLAANLLALKSPKKVSALPNSTTTINTSPKLSVTNPSLPKSPQKATNHLQSGFEMLSDSIQLQKKTGDESIPSAKRALSPNREFGEKKMRLD